MGFSLGKYVEASGIDQAWIEGGLYNSCTVTKILQGKQLYRALEAHMVTIITFYTLYFESFLEKYPTYKTKLTYISELLQKSYKDSKQKMYENDLPETFVTATHLFDASGITKALDEFEISFTNQQKFVLSYIKQYESILLYVRATRENNFTLHLESTERLIKYFFAHDHLNYARMLPQYLSCMKYTEKNHPTIWQELVDGKVFSVSKSQIPFTSIAPDHALEQENRRLKVNGGIVGITQNENALRRFFLIAPELKRLSLKFEENIGINLVKKRTTHHELYGSKSKRISDNVSKLKKIFENHGDPFRQTTNDLNNMLSHAVLPDAVAKDILDRDREGERLFQEFVKIRLKDGAFSAWDEMNRRKLGTFVNCNIQSSTQKGDKVVKLKEERGLLQRFIIASRNRPDLNLRECIGQYEFGLIPRSLFSSDGTLLLAKDKACFRESC